MHVWAYFTGNFPYCKKWTNTAATLRQTCPKTFQILKVVDGMSVLIAVNIDVVLVRGKPL